MLITNKHLHRRTFLKGMGAAIALPMLDAMTPALTAATRSGPRPVRLAFTYVPNGVTLPAGQSTDQDLHGEGSGDPQNQSGDQSADNGQ